MSFLRFLAGLSSRSRRRASIAAVFFLLCLLVWLALNAIREEIEEGVRLEIEAQSQEVIINAIESAPPPPVLSDSDFLDCLRGAGSGPCF